MNIKAVAAMTIFIGLLAGCGGESAAQKQADAAASASASAAAQAQVVATKNKDAQAKCTDATGDLQTALVNIDGRLQVGMNFSDYSNAVGAVSVAVNAMLGPKLAEMSDSCNSGVFAPLGAAFQDYKAVNDAWNACLQDINCSTKAGSKTSDLMQAKWTDASTQILKAKTALPNVTP